MSSWGPQPTSAPGRTEASYSGGKTQESGFLPVTWGREVSVSWPGRWCSAALPQQADPASHTKELSFRVRLNVPLCVCLNQGPLGSRARLQSSLTALTVHWQVSERVGLFYCCQVAFTFPGPTSAPRQLPVWRPPTAGPMSPLVRLLRCGRAPKPTAHLSGSTYRVG